MIIEKYQKLRNRLNLKPRYLRIFEFRQGINDKPHTLKESGEIKTSERHPEFLWVDCKNFKPEEYFKGGWLKGVQEYLNIRNK